MGKRSVATSPDGALLSVQFQRFGVNKGVAVVTVLRRCSILLLLSLLSGKILTGCSSHPHGTHARADDWSPTVATPEFQFGRGPVVLVDAAHGNWHTIEGRFAPFAELLRKDGYRVRSADEPISRELLQDAGVFVIANAVRGGEDSVWILPTPPALETEEMSVLVEWVEQGGALLLIADHMPFPGSVAGLADAFGIVFLNGYALKSASEGGSLVFTRTAGSLVDHPISRGRAPSEEIAFVKSFTGQAFRAVVPVEPLLLLPDSWTVFFPREAGVFTLDTAQESARGLLQGAVLRHGKGRVAVFGEAGMFTAQTLQRDGKSLRFGMNDPAAGRNAQFALNVMHWLSGVLQDAGETMERRELLGR